jgi:hypothetical protein
MSRPHNSGRFKLLSAPKMDPQREAVPEADIPRVRQIVLDDLRSAERTRADVSAAVSDPNARGIYVKRGPRGDRQARDTRGTAPEELTHGGAAPGRLAAEPDSPGRMGRPPDRSRSCAHGPQTRRPLTRGVPGPARPSAFSPWPISFGLAHRVIAGDVSNWLSSSPAAVWGGGTLFAAMRHKSNATQTTMLCGRGPVRARVTDTRH